ncbi:TPA: DNA replication and repair protein RecF, partial [Corynebacterium striatum]|nr:DNA replication and repair protein RecF [Corynebacterium striatum]
EAEQVLITAAVDEDLPGNLEPIVRYEVTATDTEDGRISEISKVDDQVSGDD